MRLFIDDERKTPSNFTHRAWTVGEACKFLDRATDRGERIELISFDWDAHKWKAITFEGVVRYMIRTETWPEEIRIHSASPDRDKLEKLLTDNAPETTIVDLTDPWDLHRIRSVENPFPAWVEPFIRETVG